MGQTPFKYYIRTEILLGKDYEGIRKDLGAYNFVVSNEQIRDEFEIMMNMLPPFFKELILNRVEVSINKEHIRNIEWLRALGIFDLYRYKTIPPHRHAQLPASLQNFQTMEWMLSYVDIRNLINRLLFNKESTEKIAVLLSAEYNREVTDKAVDFYRHYMWNTDGISAAGCFLFYKDFRANAVITKNGEVAELLDESDPSITDALMNDTEYFKWKSGMKVKLGDTNDKLEEIATDCYFKLKEAMHTTQVMDRSESAGTSMEGINFSHETKNHFNVQKEACKISKVYLDMFLRTKKAITVEDAGASEDFFSRLNQIQIDFEEEKIASYEEVFDDVKGDIK